MEREEEKNGIRDKGGEGWQIKASAVSRLEDYNAFIIERFDCHRLRNLDFLLLYIYIFFLNIYMH